MKVAELMPETKQQPTTKSTIVATYDYVDENGQLVFQVLRFEPKDFRQRKPDGRGGWDWSTKGVKQVPYRLPSILKASVDDWIFIVEGEKDVHSIESLGLVATTNAGGAKKWKNEHAQYLNEKRVAVLPDNDPSGFEHQKVIVDSLAGIAAQVRVVILPGLPPKGDVTDWIKAGGNREKLLELVEKTEDATDKPMLAPMQTTDALNCSASSWLIEENRRNDNELARKFIDRNEHRLRFVVEWQKWLVWDGKRWRVDQGNTLTLRLAREFAESLFDGLRDFVNSDSKSSDFPRLATFIRRSNDQRTLNAVVALARADERVTISVQDLNQHPGLLNVQNGVLNLESGALESHKPELLLTQLAGVSFDKDADCPLFKDAIKLIFKGDQQLIQYVQTVLGYCTTGHYGEAFIPIAFGGGANGKSFVCSVVSQILGEYATQASETLVLGNRDTHPTELADLYEKRFVSVVEPEQGVSLKEARIKALTGDRFVKCRRMGEDFWQFNRTHKFWLSTNYLPKITGGDDGIWRRIRLIPFTQNLREVTTPIAEYDRILVEQEGAGILNWLVSGYLDFKDFGFVEPTCVKAATAEYRCDQDEIRNFIVENCETGSHCMVKASTLFSAYRNWGGKLSQTSFGKELARRFVRNRPEAGAFRKCTVYEGISLLDDVEI
jgi:putative DNA primase/helicase